jgi:hypothetical protein
MSGAAGWESLIQKYLIEDGHCYAGGLAELKDGCIYAAAPGDEGWNAIYRDGGYKRMVLQDDGATEIEMDIWEEEALKAAAETGRRPNCGLWIGGVCYVIARCLPDSVHGCRKMKMLFCHARGSPKDRAAVCVIAIDAVGPQIIVGLYTGLETNFESDKNPGALAVGALAAEIKDRFDEPESDVEPSAWQARGTNNNVETPREDLESRALDMLNSRCYTMCDREKRRVVGAMSNSQLSAYVSGHWDKQ